MSDVIGESTDDILDFYVKFSQDPWNFLRFVYTLDEVDRNAPIKLFPVDLEYLRYYVRMWQLADLLAVPKSRRMKISWTTIALCTHEAAFQIGIHTAFVSKKEEDADVLLQRAKFILDNLSQQVPRHLIPRYEYKYCMLRFPETETKIEAFPSGADQLRQFTFSRIFGDEMAFWPDAQQMYKGAKPTLEGGGKLNLVSSATPSFFEKIVNDTMDDDVQPAPKSIKTPMPGLRIWKNPGNGFTVFETHYTADPAKRDPAWKAKNKAGMPIRDWNMEYEITWESWLGLPVFPDWDARVHLSKEVLMPHPGLPLLRGWDFGLTPACIVCQLVEDELWILKEYVETNMGATRFSKKVLEKMKTDFTRWSDQKKHYRDFIDPSGTYRADTDEYTCAMILQDHGMVTIPGAITWEARKKSVEEWLTKYGPKGALLRVNEAECPTLVAAMKGGYQYPENSDVTEPLKLRPVKNKYSHISDAVQMVTSMVGSLKHSSGLRVPTPKYSRQGNANEPRS